MTHRGALLTVISATILDVSAGITFSAVEHVSMIRGIYWAVTTATTVGYGDITPHDTAGYILAIACMVTIIPLVGATFSLFTSGLTSTHVTNSEERIKQHIKEHVRNDDTT